MRVCYFGTYALGEGYPVNRVVIEGLRRAGVEVIECHVPLWEGGAAEKLGALTGWLGALRLAGRVAQAYLALIRKFWKIPPYDVLLVGYPGQLDLPLAWILNRIRRRPLVLNAFLSLYDTAVTDRRAVPPGSWRARLLHRLDRAACRIADLTLLDTEAQIQFFVREFNLPRDRFLRVYVGSDERYFRPQPEGPPRQRFHVVFTGTYIPLHGVEQILEAAALVRDELVRFTLIGTGQLIDEISNRAIGLALTNVEMIKRWMPPADLAVYLSSADVCLGIFGTSEKAERVIPCKVFDALAMARAVVTGDSPAIRELLTNGENVLLVERGNPRALAEGIRMLKNNPVLRQRIAKQGYETYRACCAPEAVGRALTDCLAGLLRADTRRPALR